MYCIGKIGTDGVFGDEVHVSPESPLEFVLDPHKLEEAFGAGKPDQDRMAEQSRRSDEPTAGRGMSQGEQVLKERNPTRITAEPGKQEMIVTREFDAPRDLIFRAHTDPKLYEQWIGPRGFTTKIETFESRNGGSWRYIQTDKDGNEYGFHGVNHDVAPPERIIQTFEYEGLPEPGHVILEAAKFDELPGSRTRFIGRSVFLSVEDRDGMMQSDMEEGMKDSYSRLDELLERLQK
nr:SRPBCC family protein [Methanoculleus marisnigri]